MATWRCCLIIYCTAYRLTFVYTISLFGSCSTAWYCCCCCCDRYIRTPIGRTLSVAQTQQNKQQTGCNVISVDRSRLVLHWSLASLWETGSVTSCMLNVFVFVLVLFVHLNVRLESPLIGIGFSYLFVMQEMLHIWYSARDRCRWRWKKKKLICPLFILDFYLLVALPLNLYLWCDVVLLCSPLDAVVG